MADVIKIYIPDKSYDNEEVPRALAFSEITAALTQLRSPDLEITPPQEANIGAGADWPAWAIQFSPYIPTASIIAIFFSGKRINENLDAWLAIGRKLCSFTSFAGSWLNRSAAAMVALFKLSDEIDIRSSLWSYCSTRQLTGDL